jgi:PadR family transcriptional regulator, regulatory protein PadR
MTTRSRRFSPQTLKVLAALADAGSGWRYGLELAESTGLKSGSLYPILLRLADRGLLESRWEEPGQTGGRPPRHSYRLSGAGRAVLNEAFEPSEAPLKEAFS